MLLFLQSNELVGLAIFGGGLLLLYIIEKVILKKSIGDYLQDNFTVALERVASFSTITEVLSLIISANNDGMLLASAITRFGIAGVFELLFIFFFFKTAEVWSQKITDRIFDDGKFKVLEIGWYFIYIIVLTPMWMFCSIPTIYILELYYESAGVTYINTGSVNIDIFNMNFDFGIGKEVVNNNVNKISLGATGLVLATPILNALQAITIPILHFKIAVLNSNENSNSYHKKSSKKAIKKGKDFNSTISNIDTNSFNSSPDTLTSKDIFDWIENNFKRINRSDIESNWKNHIKNDRNYIDGTASKKEVEDRMIRFLSGQKNKNNPDGILGWNYLNKKVEKLAKLDEDYIIKCNSLTDKVTEIRKERDIINDASDPNYQKLDKEYKKAKKELTEANSERRKISEKYGNTQDKLKNLFDSIETIVKNRLNLLN